MSAPKNKPNRPRQPVDGVARPKGELHRPYMDRIRAAGWVIESSRIGGDYWLIAALGDKRIIVSRPSELGAWLALDHEIAPPGWPES